MAIELAAARDHGQQPLARPFPHAAQRAPVQAIRDWVRTVDRSACRWAGWARTSDLAGLVVYLASPAAEYVTGQTINLDGGLSTGN